MLQAIVFSQIASTPGVRRFTGADFFEPRQPEWGRALHRSCRSEATRAVGHGQSANIDRQAWCTVCQKAL